MGGSNDFHGIKLVECLTYKITKQSLLSLVKNHPEMCDRILLQPLQGFPICTQGGTVTLNCTRPHTHLVSVKGTLPAWGIISRNIFPDNRLKSKQ